MRILALVAEPPWPAVNGYRIRCWELLRRLAVRHAVRLLVLDRSGRDAPPSDGGDWRAVFESVRLVRGARTSPLSLFRSLAASAPHHALLHDGTALRAALAEESRGCDALYVHYLYFARALRSLGPDRPPCVLDQHNLDHETWASHAARARGPLRWWLLRQERLVRADERELLGSFDAILPVSEADARATRELAGPRPAIVVAPNGADCTTWRPSAGSAGGSTLIFSGTSARRNIDGLAWFLRDAWPLVRAELPSAQLVVAGSLDPRRLPRGLRGEAGVTFTGAEPDLRSRFSSADLAIVPVRAGGGTKLKTFEALACGLPVVASSEASRGLCCGEGEGVLVAPDAVTYAAAVVRLLRDPEQRRRLGARGRDHAERVHDWSRVADIVDGALGLAVEAGHRVRREGTEPGVSA